MKPPPNPLLGRACGFSRNGPTEKEMKNRKPKTGNKKPVNSAGFTSPVFGFLFSIHPLRGLLVALALLVLALPAGAKPLESQVKGLLGGLATSISPVGVGDPRNVLPKDL